MTTELELIYTIHNIVTGGEYNADSPINERLMRQFISIHRGKQLNQYYKEGVFVGDECFQGLGDISFTVNSKQELVSGVLPKVIRFEKGRYGIIATKNGYIISVMNSEEFHNASKDRYNKFHPRMKFINEKLYFDIGKEQSCSQPEVHSNSVLNTTVRQLLAEKNLNSVKAEVSAVLVNPSDSPYYDWKTSPYPLPDELIENIITSVNAREFDLFLRTRSDETGDLRKNNAETNTREEL